MHLLLLFPSHSFRIELSNTVANAAGFPLGNVLVYDVVQFNYSQESCLSATLRFTGASGEYQVEEWTGLLPQEVGRAVTPWSGWGYHFKKWVWLLISLSGQGYHCKWWVWSSSQVVGMLPHQGVGGALTSRGGWGCRHPIRLCHLTLIKCH